MANIKIYEEECLCGTPNCNGGNYPAIIAVNSDGVPVWTGNRCGCWKGCSNTTSREELFELFPDWSGEVNAIPFDEFAKLMKVYVDSRP